MFIKYLQIIVLIFPDYCIVRQGQFLTKNNFEI